MTVKACEYKTLLATDCGSTTSKARFFSKIGDEYRFVVAGEAPTTVEAPYEDVTYGIKNAIREVEELTGRKILKDDGSGIIMPSKGNEGVDVYVTTSSAGGGLQMVCTGIVKNMTAESAERAALGAGAIVMDVISNDDNRLPFQKIRRLRALRPDMVLVAGGTDGGEIHRILETCEIIKAADPKPRFGSSYSLPIIYAGNNAAVTEVKKIFGDKYSITIVDNIRPSLDLENSGPAREAIHTSFMEHVMSHAPGYPRLMTWTPVPIMPTPAGEGTMFQKISEVENMNVIGVGLGGATTNIYSIYEGRFVRTVSANLGMSYSLGNVLKTTGIKNILRWIPFKISENEVRQQIYNKMIRPTVIPQTTKQLMIEHAVAREAISLGFKHHLFLARPLRGARTSWSGWTSTYQTETDYQSTGGTYIDMMKVKWIGGTGGLLSHAPLRVQAALLLIDSFQPVGFTSLGQDSVFMMPHLGVLSTVAPDAAMDIFNKDCLVKLGTCIAPKGTSNEGKEVGKATITMPDGKTVEETLIYGEIKRIPLNEGLKADVEVNPSLSFDFGKGTGRSVKTEVEGGVVGIILDTRGRPFTLTDNENERMKKLQNWYTALDAYPKMLDLLKNDKE